MPKSRIKRKNGKVISGKKYRYEILTQERTFTVAKAVNKAGKTIRKAYKRTVIEVKNVIKHENPGKLLGMGLYENHFKS